MARVLVTGSSGFIGGHLIRALVAAGHQVTGLDVRVPVEATAGVRHFTCDIRERAAVLDTLAEAAPEVVLHLAARTDLDEQHDLTGYAANFAGVAHLAEAIRATPSIRRAVCTSSQLVCRIGYVPTGDQDYCPSTLYGESKVLTEKVWREADGGGVEWCLVRPTTIWGPGMNPHYLRFFGMIRRGKYFHVGGGPRYKSYGFVGNTVHQYRMLMTAPAEAIHRKTLFLADYKPIALEAWADAFAVALGAPKIPTLPAVLATAAARVGDVVNLLGWKGVPFNSFRLGNVLTQYIIDMSATEAVCGPVPCSMQEGVRDTAAWLERVWGAESTVISPAREGSGAGKQASN